MDNKQKNKEIGSLVEDELQEIPDYFLVEVKVSAAADVKVFLDADKGVSVDRLSRLNRSLYKKIAEREIFPDGNFALEVSSPGLDEPLKLARQYSKNIGRMVEVQLADGQKQEGLLKAVENDYIKLEVKAGKGKETMESILYFSNIKSTKVSIVF